jgi:hypothetical protein
LHGTSNIKYAEVWTNKNVQRLGKERMQNKKKEDWKDVKNRKEGIERKKKRWKK